VFLWLPFMWSGGGGVGEVLAKQSAGASTWLIRVRSRLQFWRNLMRTVQVFCRYQSGALRWISQRFGGDAADWPLTLGQLKATGVDFGVFLFRLLLDGQQGLRRENLFVFKLQEREKAALSLLNLFWVRNFRVSGQLAGLSAGKSEAPE